MLAPIGCSSSDDSHPAAGGSTARAGNGGSRSSSVAGAVGVGNGGAPGSAGLPDLAGGSSPVAGGSTSSHGGSRDGDAGSGAGGHLTGTGGTTGVGGMLAGTGGALSNGGAAGALTPQQAAKLMSPGWNLGNSFDASPNETSWGNPTPSQTLINAVHSAGFKTLRLPVTWTNHIGAGPSYTIDSAWMSKVKQTAQWAVDAGMYVFVNTHHEADGKDGGWITFPSSTWEAQNVAKEVTAVWTQIATAFKSFNGTLLFECFNEPNMGGGGNTPTAQSALNMYLEACHQAIRGTGGANATRIIMIQPIGASPNQAGIQSMQKVSFINDPNLIISLHTYYPTSFGLSTTPDAWGSASDYGNMQNSIAKQIRTWLPTQVIVVGEWGSMAAQATGNRASHALAYAQDTTTAGIVPVWWDNGGSGSSSFALFDRKSGAQTQPTIVSGIMTGVKNGLVAPNTWATPGSP
ncbi:MAG TPA: glycoside hydrolase family 5 protein [Polyangiaceae bacterium]|nr:glycoside hydrolase family 5 protein [Polyangiaceae bacterium]